MSGLRLRPPFLCLQAMCERYCDMEKDILMTSGFNFEGYTISEYLGVFSGECAIGLGAMRALWDHPHFSDSDVESKVYSCQSKKAKKMLWSS